MAANPGGPGPHIDARGRVQVDVITDCSDASSAQELTAAGLSIGVAVRVGSYCVTEGWLFAESLPQIAGLSGVVRVRIPDYAIARGRPGLRTSSHLLSQPGGTAGSGIDGNGVAIMRAGQFLAQTKVNGSGVTVGVQSTGVASLSVIQARQELPAVQVLTPGGGSNSTSADEGTVLLEEIHAVAPGAQLAFCGPESFVEYTSCVQQLIGAGATVLVDDVVFPAQQLMSADGPDVQALGQILTANPGVMLFTAAGNFNGSYWEGNYAPVSVGSLGMAPLSCTSGGSNQTDSYVHQFAGPRGQLLTVSESFRVPVAFAWADPAAANASNFDLYFVSSNGSQKFCFVTAGSTDTQVTQTLLMSAGTYTVYIATPDAGLAGKFVKLWIGGDGLTTLSASTPGSIVTPQALASGAVSVGAVNGSDALGNTIEPFSSVGPFAAAFPTPAHLQVPVLVAPDGIYVDAAGTYFAADLFPDGNFYGTSASVPNAGAVAALMLSAFPKLTVPQILTALKAGAAQLAGSGSPDPASGYGRIDALGALGTLPGPTITALPDLTLAAGATSPSYSFSVSGTSDLHFSVSSSDTALIPAAIVTAGAPGVHLAPAECGSSVTTCSLTVTAAAGVSDTVTLTLLALDGANRSAQSAMHVMVNGSAPPVQTQPPSPSGGGGGLGWLDLLALGAMWAPRGRRRCWTLARSIP